MSYTCSVCGDEFEGLAELGQHAREQGHTKKNKGSSTSKGGGGTTTPKSSTLLTDEDKEQLRQEELEIRQLELSVKKARLESQLRQFNGQTAQNREKSWVLPDGTSFQGTAQDYKDMLQIYYQVQAIRGKSGSKDNDGESETIRLLKEQNARLEKTIDDKWKADIESKLNYAISRDPLDTAEEAMDKLSTKAEKWGFFKGSNIRDDLAIKKASFQEHAANTTLNRIDSRLAQLQGNTKTLIDGVLPALTGHADQFVKEKIQQVRNKRAGQVLDPTEEQMIAIERSLDRNAGVQQDMGSKQPENPKSEPENKIEPVPNEDHMVFTIPELKFTGIGTDHGVPIGVHKSAESSTKGSKSAGKNS